MGHKPEIISHIPRTLEQIADAIFAKDKLIQKAKTKQGNKDTKNNKGPTPSL